MKSPLSKVLHPLGGQPLISYVLSTLQSLEETDTVLVLSEDMTQVKDFCLQQWPSLKIAYQKQALGTANAVLSAENFFDTFEGNLLVVFGDTPLIQKETLSRMTETLDTADIVLVGMTPEDKRKYGRIITEDGKKVQKIIEHKEADQNILKNYPICNSGIMGFKAKHARSLLKKIPLINEEYYLTEAAKLAFNQGLKVELILADEREFQGINSQADLATAEQCLQNQWRQQAMEAGVTLLDPPSVFFSYDTVLHPGTIIEPHVFIGNNVTIQSNARIRSFSYLEGAVIGEGCVVGPFARLRAQTVLGKNARVGNFVEIKNSTLESEAKVNHLSYIGDAEVGKKTNIGAGTITCNYDGFQKHKTIIEDDVFVGSNTALVAPLKIEKGAIIGAGSTITKNVLQESLTLTRSDQKTIKEGAKKYASKKLAHIKQR